ncbi:MAG TPA: CRTAC1 family protein [Vicinamibacterales bacterium]|nr:CRTAC1 family protein [Vicinamibacterales bacterium]
MQPRWLACLGFGCLAACGSPQSPTLASDGAPPSDWFTDQAQAVGLAFRHVNGMTGELTLVEIMGAGVGLFDYDNDGDLDVYAVQGGRLPGGGGAGGDRLYRNDLTIAPDGTRALRFTDVTEEAGIDVQSYGMGVAAGDIDNDGWVDLYLTRFGPDVLLHNNGNGTFSDITRQAGIADSAWSVPASFLDFDRDGWLDLYVGHYVRYDVAHDIDCRGPTGTADYCTPQAYRPVAGRLYRNRRNRTFADVTLGSGIAGEYGPALGSIAADVDGDRWVDLYVANDGTPNQLWLNQRGARFRNGALLAGVAVSGEGRPEGSMGVDAGDFDEDGDEDLIVTNLFGEGTVLYVNDGAGVFEDRGAASGLRPASRRLTGFGVAWVDADNDGWLDVLSVNGAVQRAQPFATPGDPFPLGQPMQLLRNRGDGRFEDVTAQAGRAFGISAVGRGAAFGDVDNDGDADVVVSTNNGPLRLLVNRRGHRKHWIGLRLVAASGRDALGARVAIVMPDGMTRWRRVRSDGSYASANDPRVLVGLGDSKAIPRLRIEWPDGRTEERMLDGIDRWVTIRERQ